jgi:endonuclease/exonuclease/phosphatase family metal-dependent hydrolase
MKFLSVLLIIIVNYNVENLFHPAHDSLKDDIEWTADGERHWSYTRYYKKVDNIARVLTNIGEWDGVDVVGLQEVENALCVKRLCYTLRRNEYDFVHYESPDRRGIDVALIYKKARVDTIRTRAIPVKLSQTTSNPQTTRDILYVSALVDKQDTMHFFVCHLPSQRGGKAESEWKREAAKQVLERAIDSVYATNPDAKIIVMGDMNSGDLKVKGLKDKWTNEKRPMTNDQSGTHKYQGRWTFLDHFYVSPAIDSVSQAEVYNAEWIQEPDEKYLGLKPKRTYNGFHYQNGYSDHLPIVLRIEK